VHLAAEVRALNITAIIVEGNKSLKILGEKDV
jgi:hypothetical protein